MRYRFIQQHEGRFSVSSLCRVLQVSRSGYSAWKKRPPSERSQQETKLLMQIRAVHDESRGTYGSPRIYRELRDQQMACSRNRVARIMRKYQITARPLRRRTVTTDARHDFAIASNLLEQIGTEVLRRRSEYPLVSKVRIPIGPPTLRICGRAKVGCISRSSSISILDGSSGGRYRTHWTALSSWRPCGTPFNCGSPNRG
jgi:transposase InsO family protein